MIETLRQGTEFLRCGFTTGTCAALATKACGIRLLTGESLEEVSLLTPLGITVTTNVQHGCFGEGFCSASVFKDGGDDIDVTHGAEIVVHLSLCSQEESQITGGVGVGRVTKKGLDQEVGNYAINSVPRKQIQEVLRELGESYHYTGGFLVEISVPQGEVLAKKTLNEKLGILGGISILGTSGIVQPRSLEALLSSIGVEIKMHYAQGRRDIILTPGNYGMAYLENHPWVNTQEVVQISNFIGDALDLLVVEGFQRVLLVGHLGKLSKVAGGIMQTHSRYADGRAEIFTAYTALSGGSPQLLTQMMESVTTDASLELLIEAGLEIPVLEKICASAQKHLELRVKGAMEVGILMFSHKHDRSVCSLSGEKIIESWNQKP